MANKWLTHLAQIRKENPDIKDVSKLAKLAKATYKPMKK